MGPQNCPKIDPKLDKSLTNRYKAYKTFPKWLRSSKNIQKHAKTFKKATNMAASWDPNSNKIHAKSVSRDRFFLGTRNSSKHVQQVTTSIPLWLHHGTECLPYGKVSSATSAVCQGWSQPASSNTMHSFVFFHDRLYEYGYCVCLLYTSPSPRDS